MTQPRKEQIKDIQAKFSVLDPTLAATLGLAQSAIYTVGNYTTFINGTITKTLGGAVDTSSGFYTGTVAGPRHGVAALDSFTITIPQLNGGNPIAVVIQSGDIVTISSVATLPVSRLAARINAVIDPLLLAYTTAHSLPTAPSVASNSNGHLKLQTPFTGDTSSLTIADVTLGILNAIFTPTASLTITGVTSPKRGIVTISPDGLGGLSSVRLANGEPCITRQAMRMHVGNGKYSPDSSIGQDIYAKITGVVGTSATVSFYTYGTLQPQVVTAISDFSSLNGAHTLGITITDPALGTPVVLSIGFGSTPTNPAAVITLINNAWHASGGFDTTAYGPAKGTAVIAKTAFAFTSTSRFDLVLNGNAPISIIPGTATISGTTLAAFINAAIVSAGQVAQGAASVNATGGVVIQSSHVTSDSSVELQAGAGTDMSALDEMGIAPGIYHGSSIAEAYGSDEIRIFNPSRNSGASLAISGSGPTLGFMGLTAVTHTITIGEEPAVPGAYVKVLVSEAMEFGEVPDSHESTVEQFDSVNTLSILDPTMGIKNAGMAPVLGQDGKIPVSAINHILDSLSLESITLGAKSVSTLTDLLKPRITAPFATALGKTLIATFVDSSGTGKTTRLYMSIGGALQKSENASYNNSTNLWSKDTNGVSASLISLEDGFVKTFTRLAADNGTWAEGPSATTWREVASIGVNPAVTSLMTLGTNYIDGVLPNTPRQKNVVADDTVNGGLTLLSESIPTSGADLMGKRIYHDSIIGAVVATVNAKWGGTTWSKDVTGQTATMTTYSFTAIMVSARRDSHDTPWAYGAWDYKPIQSGYAVTGDEDNTILSGALELGNSMSDSANGRTTSRLFVNHTKTTNGLRTLVSSWVGGNGQNHRTYRGVGFDPSVSIYFDNKDIVITTNNARWDETGNVWHQDVSDLSTMTITSNQYVQHFVKKLSAPSTWADSAWVLVANFWENGLSLSSSSDSTNAAGAKNLLGLGNLVKAFGTIYNVAGTYTLGDVFGVSSIVVGPSGPVAANEIKVNLTAAMTNAGVGYCVVCSVVSNDLTKVSSSINSGSSFSLFFYDSTTHLAYNNSSNGNNANFIVMGYQ